MFTRIFSILRSIIAILFSFISNSILVSLFLTFLVTIVDVHQWKWVQTILQWLKWPVTQNNAFALFFCVFLVLPFLLSPSRLMAWILAKTNGWRKAGAEEKDYIQSHIDNVLSRGGLKKKKYHLYIVEEPDINAAAFGVNNILVTRGTIIAAEQNPGLMEGFLAHEMGHITYGHSFVLSFIIVMESCGRASSYVLEKINWFLAEVVGRIPLINLVSLLMCDKEAIEVQKILPFLSDTWPLCRIGRAVIRASQSCRQSCNKSQCPACGCRSHHSCTHAPQFSRSFPAREWGSVLQRQGACGQCP